MINLLVGEYGCGKSTRIFESIKKDYENGVLSLLIVPEQYTVACEKQIASQLPPKAQLFCEALNFTRLANKVFRKYGGLKYNYITDSAKNLIMYLAITEARDDLKEYKIAKGHEKSCITMFLQTIFELKSYSITPMDLEKAKEKLSDEALKDKLHDIISVWTRYEKILSVRFSDPLDDMRMLSEKLENIKFFKGYNVYIDSFYGFTRSQYDIISYIIRDAENVTLSFDCCTDIAEPKMEYAKVVKSIKDIMHICNKRGKEYNVEKLETDYKHTSEDIKHICKNLWSFSDEKKKSCGDVRLVCCGDEFDECEFVASSIKRLIEEGNKYNEVCIIARNSDTYRGILDYTLKKFDIPYFYSSPSNLLGMPIIKMVFNALNAISTYKADDIIAYTKCGYTDIDNLSVSMLEEYMTRWGIYGKRFLNNDYWGANPDGYVDHKTDKQEERLRTVLNARSQVISMLSILEKPFLAQKTVKDCANALYSFLKAHNIVEKLESEKAKADKEEAYLIVQVYKALLSALDTLVDVCGDIVVNPNTFATLLHYAFIDADVGSIPTGEDNVLIADASMVRATKIKHVFLIGANEGVFPASVKESSFFTDNDKDLLKKAEITLSEKTDIRSCDELMFFKNSIAIASKGATISSLNFGIMGESMQASVGFTRIQELFDGLEVEAASKNVIDRIYTPKNALEYYSVADDDLKKAISEKLGVNISAGHFSNEHQSLSEETLKNIYNSDEIKLTQSSIEKFQSCHFNYYASSLLKLRSNRKFEFSSIEIGNMFHSVFEHALKKVKDLNGDFSSFTDDDVTKLVSENVSNYIKAICMGAFETNKLTHLFSKMEKNLQVLTKKIVDEFRHNPKGFMPAYFELNFDGDGKKTPLPLEIITSDKTRALLHGKPDRIDIYRTETDTYVRIVDYKTGKKDFNMSDFEKGTMLQLFIYLFALCNMRSCEFKRKLLGTTKRVLPAGAYYMPLKVGKTVVDTDLLANRTESMQKSMQAVMDNAFPNGRFLDDAVVSSAQDTTGIFFPNKKTSKSYLKINGFTELFEKMSNVVNSVVCSMKNGDASAIPLEDDSFYSTCDYCENKAFCRRRK